MIPNVPPEKVLELSKTIRPLVKVYAFEIVDKPRDAADLNKEREALNAGFHVATTRLYLKP